MATSEVYQATRIAHTARCKLHLEADRPDRNLRFILGHAFTLDKMMLRIAEIEIDSTIDENELANDNMPLCPNARKAPVVSSGDRKVSFSGTSGIAGNGNGNGGGIGGGRRSPPPPPQLESDSSGDEDEDDKDDIEEDDEEDDNDGLGLTRFASASGHARGSSREADPTILSEEELREVCAGEGNEELRGLYDDVSGCPCHV